MSGRGPSAVIFHGVWQSWQPDVETMYLPRATSSSVGLAGAAGSAARANDANTTSAKNANNFRDFIETSSN